jgi:hypothetical protein
MKRPTVPLATVRSHCSSVAAITVDGVVRFGAGNAVPRDASSSIEEMIWCREFAMIA